MTANPEPALVRRPSSLSLVLLAVVVTFLLGRSCAGDTSSPGITAAQLSASTSDVTNTENTTRRRVTAADAATDESTVEDATAPEPAAAPLTKTTLSPPNTKLALPMHEIEGRVADTDGNPQSGVAVRLASTWLPDDERLALQDIEFFPRCVDSVTSTAADGTFRLAFVDGGSRRLFAGPSFDPLAICDVTPGAFHEIVMPTAPPVIDVTVIDVDGEPVAGARVMVWAQVAWSVPVWTSQTAAPLAGDTDADGVVRLTGAAVGTSRISIEAAMERGVVNPVRIDVPPSGRLRKTIHLKRAIRARGRVIDAETDRPISGASVRYDFAHLCTTSDSEGRFEFLLPFELHTLSSVAVEAPGYAREMGTIAYYKSTDASDSDESVIRLQRPATVILRCVGRDGAPLAGVVAIARSTAIDTATSENAPRRLSEDVGAGVSDDDGRVTIRNLHAGSDIPLRVLLRLSGVQVLDHGSAALEVGERRDLGDVVVADGRTLTGRVTTPDGDVIAGALVLVVARDPAADADAREATLGMALMMALNREGRRTETATDGTFALPGLSPGLWDVIVARPLPGLLRESVQVTPGQDPGPIELRLPKSVTVKARVFDRNGEPVAAGYVLYPVPTLVKMRTQDAVEIGTDGRFEIPGFSPDAEPFEIQVGAGPGALQTFTIDPRAGPATLRLR